MPLWRSLSGAPAVPSPSSKPNAGSKPPKEPRAVATVLHLSDVRVFAVLADGASPASVSATIAAGKKPSDAAYIHYELLPNSAGIDLTSTWTPESLRGRGLAGDLTARAVAWAADAGHASVKASCSYVATWGARGDAGAGWTWRGDTLVRTAA